MKRIILAVILIATPAQAQNLYQQNLAAGFAQGFNSQLYGQPYGYQNPYPNNADKMIMLLQSQEALRIERMKAEAYRESVQRPVFEPASRYEWQTGDIFKK